MVRKCFGEANSTCVAQLLDSGNLVVVEDASKRVVWQSFDYPTDTLLPGMKLGVDRKMGLRRCLTSWRSADDPGIGDYSLELNPIGGPQVFLYKHGVPIWRGLPGPSSNYADIKNFVFVNNPDEVSIFYFLYDDSVILIIVIDHLGFSKHLSWNEKKGEWKKTLAAPKYQCDKYRKCGVNSKCRPTLPNRVFECECLPGFEPKNMRDWNVLRDGSGGCVRKHQESYKSCTPGEGFVPVPHVKLPDTSESTWVDVEMDGHDCEQACRSNCSCTAFSNVEIVGKGTGCQVWFGELVDTVDRVEAGSDLYVRVDAFELASRTSERFLGMKSDVAVLVLSVSLAWFLIGILAYLMLKRRRKRVRDRWRKRFAETFGNSYHQIDALAANESRESRSHLDIAFYSLRIISTATNDFSEVNKLGEGGFGSIYKGQLRNGKAIAVKKLGKNSGQGLEEFKNEVTLIAKLQHKNLVKLIGCCIDGEETMLIYEYLSNKSLDLFLFDGKKKQILDWKERFTIIVGIARGILHLHQDSRLRIIHRDLKTSNILLDKEMNPKISDFGTAKMFSGDQIQERMNKVVGTFGYMSPEYVMFGKYSTKSDVYSYGVILLEIISGKKNNLYGEDPSLSLIEHVWKLWREERALEVVDPSLKESYDSGEVLRFIQIGLLCVQENEADRPTIFNVVLMLNSEMSLPSPKQPAFIIHGKPFTNPQLTTKEKTSCSVNEMTITTFVSR